MAHSIEVSPCGRYIILTATGDYTRALAMADNLEAHALGAKLGIRRYLVDVTGARNIESVLDQYEFAYQDMAVDEGIDRHARVALLVAPEDHSHDFVAVAVANSGVDIRLFTDRAEAERHLTA